MKTSLRLAAAFIVGAVMFVEGHRGVKLICALVAVIFLIVAWIGPDEGTK